MLFVKQVIFGFKSEYPVPIGKATSIQQHRKKYSSAPAIKTRYQSLLEIKNAYPSYNNDIGDKNPCIYFQRSRNK